MQDRERVKVVTRTFFEGTCFDDMGNTRDTHWFTADELSAWLRECQKDASEFGCSGTVNVNGKPYASFARGQYSPIPRCPRCTVRHYSPCLSEPVSAVEALGMATEYQAPRVFRGATFSGGE